MLERGRGATSLVCLSFEDMAVSWWFICGTSGSIKFANTVGFTVCPVILSSKSSFKYRFCDRTNEESHTFVLKAQYLKNGFGFGELIYYHWKSKLTRKRDGDNKLRLFTLLFDGGTNQRRKTNKYLSQGHSIQIGHGNFFSSGFLFCL